MAQVVRPGQNVFADRQLGAFPRLFPRRVVNPLDRLAFVAENVAFYFSASAVYNAPCRGIQDDKVRGVIFCKITRN